MPHAFSGDQLAPGYILSRALGRFVAMAACLLVPFLMATTPAELTRWQEQAVGGDGQAQWCLSQAYEKGEGVERDRGKALVWLQSAAESGVAEAQYALAANYFQGDLGLRTDVRTALDWLNQAAVQGFVPASYRLGEIYFHGYGGVGQNFAMAAAAMKKPAASGYADAKVYLGYLYLTGQGLALNEEKGLALLRDAAAAGNTRALSWLWEAFAAGKVEPKDDAERQSWLEAGGQGGDLRAKEQLGLSLFLGRGMPQDRERARPLLQEAAQNGSVPAATALAEELGEKLSGPNSGTLSESARRSLILDYNRMVHLIAMSGGISGMETYIRVISRLQPLTELVRPNALGRLSMGEDLIEALAWGRIYRERGGNTREIVAWCRDGEAWLKNYAAAATRVAQREQELRAALAATSPQQG